MFYFTFFASVAICQALQPQKQTVAVDEFGDTHNIHKSHGSDHMMSTKQVRIVRDNGAVDAVDDDETQGDVEHANSDNEAGFPIVRRNKGQGVDGIDSSPTFSRELHDSLKQDCKVRPMFMIGANVQCKIDPDTNCVSSPGYPNYYGNDGKCNIYVDTDNLSPIKVESFSTEGAWNGKDYLLVNGEKYVGHRDPGPEGVVPTGHILWSSDHWYDCCIRGDSTDLPDYYWTERGGNCFEKTENDCDPEEEPGFRNNQGWKICPTATYDNGKSCTHDNGR